MIALALALALGAAAPAPVREASAITLPGLSYWVLASGPRSGIPPERGDSITVRYVGRLANGTVFNSSADEGRGVTTFELNKLIPGWVAALRLMRPGDRWALTLPPYLAYGGIGKPEHGISPDATLSFEVELVAVTKAAPEPKP